jgi:hypothetical protein
MTTTKIALDRYVYEDIYPAIKVATDEKEGLHGLIRHFWRFWPRGISSSPGASR